jgi:hypothetical protein
MIAISPNNEIVEIYSYRAGQFDLQATLKEHSNRVTGIDWCVMLLRAHRHFAYPHTHTHTYTHTHTLSIHTPLFPFCSPLAGRQRRTCL